jgi:hypothetical protein
MKLAFLLESRRILCQNTFIFIMGIPTRVIVHTLSILYTHFHITLSEVILQVSFVSLLYLTNDNVPLKITIKLMINYY